MVQEKEEFKPCRFINLCRSMLTRWKNRVKIIVNLILSLSAQLLVIYFGCYQNNTEQTLRNYKFIIKLLQFTMNSRCSFCVWSLMLNSMKNFTIECFKFLQML